MPTIEVSELAIYPVKSTAQIKLLKSNVDDFGLTHDRRFMIVDGNDRFLTQRQQARMCLIKTELIDNGVCLQAPGMQEIKISTQGLDKKRSVIVWKDHCVSNDCGDEVAAWLSEFLALECRLVFFPADEVRIVDQGFAQPDDKTAFSDGFPLLLTSESSLADLNNRLSVPITMSRFRPNLVIRGCDAYAEDSWQRIKIGAMTFRVVKACSRCVIPNIDPATAERSLEPGKTLAGYRKRGNRIYFGQNIIPDGPGCLEVGMLVEILDSK